MSGPETNVGRIEGNTGIGIGPVVVGFDSSEGAAKALGFAARQAAQRGVSLRVVHAFQVVVSELGLGVGVPWDAESVAAIRDAAVAEVSDAAASLRDQHPGLEVSEVVATGPAAAVLLENSQDASLLVVGSHGQGGFFDRLLGNVSREVATHSKTPCIVVRDPAPTSDALVVGIDGSPDSLRALAFAFDEASRQGYRLIALHSWDVPPIGAITGVPAPEPPDLVQEIADNELRASLEELAGFTDRYPDVIVEHKVIRGSAVKSLVDASADAALLVVGSRGRGGFMGLLLGSVSHGVLHHAKGNVAVVSS